MGKKKKSVVIGYSYFLGLAYAFAAKVDKIIHFKMDADITGSPNLTENGSFVAKTGKSGDTMGSDYGDSTVRAYLGNQTEPDPYLAKQTGSECAYKDTAYFVMEGGFIGDNVQSAPNYKLVVERTNLFGWEHQNINGDSNPAHVLYYILTKMAQYPEELINIQSFKNCAKTLFDEDLGMSFVMSSADECKEWCEEILRTIDGVLQIDENAQIKLKLLRGDYTLANCPQINESNSKGITFERKSWENCFTRITVKYTERESFKEASVSGINTAARLTLGYERAESVEFMGISRIENANLILNRLFKKLSYPLASVKFSISALEFPNIRVGDVASFSNNKLGVSNLAIRIISISGDKEDEQTVEIEATEDIFSLGDMVITGNQGNEWQEQSYEIGELLYYDVKNAKPELSDVKAVIPMAVFPSGFTQSILVQDGLTGESVEIQKWYLGVLSKAYDKTNVIDDEVGFFINAVSEMWDMEGTQGAWQRLGFVAYIGDEQIAYRVRKKQADGTYHITDIIRGLNDTPITTHPIGEKVWFASLDAKDVEILPIVSNNPIIRFTPKNFKFQGTTKTLAHNYDFSVETPYPPSGLEATRVADEITIIWKPRVRLAGANYRNADNIVFGEDEGKQEGSYLVEWQDGSFETQELSFKRTDSQVKEYTITSILNTHKSKPRKVTV